MTITYTADVATCRHLGCFWKLLFRWKGSIYKLLWVNMLLYTLLFMSFKLCYLYWMSPATQLVMMNVGKYCHAFEEAIPLSFLLGFYVAIVIARWWDQYLSIPWPDGLAVLVSVFVIGQDVRGRVMRRTIVRYANLTLVMVFTMVSPFVKRRFPNYQSFVDAGLLLPSEHQRLKELDKRTNHPKHWVPLVWAIAIVARARREGKIADDVSKETIISEINGFRGTCGSLLNYDWISIPLVYPQVVSWAVYTYFATTIISYQFPEEDEINENQRMVMYIPVFPLLQFFFYMGWLLVAETLANPFGEDDDDFDISWLIDRNLQVSYCIADEMHHTHPELLKDQYWDDVLPPDLPWNPYTDTGDSDDQDSPDSKGGEPSTPKKEGNWPSGPDLPLNVAKTDFISRSLDFGSERVIRIYLPPSISRITLGSGQSRGSRPSGDSRQDYLPVRDFANDGLLPEARTQIFHHQRTNDKEDDVPRLAPAFYNYIQSRGVEDIPHQDNFIYNRNRGTNQDMTNPSSQNVIQIGIIDKRRDQGEAPIRSDSSSSLGLRYLLSENVFQKLNHMNKDKSDAETTTLEDSQPGPPDDESILVEDMSKISKDEKVHLGSKSRSWFKSILKSQEDKMHSFIDKISSHEEKSVKSFVRTISMPVAFGKELVDDIEEIIEECPIPIENIKSGHGATLEIVEKYNEHEYEEMSTTNSIDLPKTSGHYRLSAETSEHSQSAPMQIPFQTTADYEALSDQLFDHILNLELSKSQNETDNSEGKRNQQGNDGIDEKSDDAEEYATGLSGQSSKSSFSEKNLERTGNLIFFDSDLEQSESGEMIKKERLNFKSVIDGFDSQEREESYDLLEKPSENDLLGYDESFIYEVIDEVTYSLASENNSTCIFNETPAEDAHSYHACLSDRESTKDEIILNEDKLTEKLSCESTESDSGTKQAQDDIPRQSVSATVSLDEGVKIENMVNVTQPDSGANQIQSSTESQSEMEEFRNKVEQAVSFKHCSISPSQPKILSTKLQQSPPLSPLLELPEEPDSDADIS